MKKRRSSIANALELCVFAFSQGYNTENTDKSLNLFNFYYLLYVY